MITSPSSDYDRPAGALEPPSQGLAEIDSALERGAFERALDAVDEHDATSSLHGDWEQYLKGRAFYGLEYFEAGYNAFEVPYERTTEILPERELGPRMRLAAKCLQKMGWLHRRNEEFQRGYALHAIQYRYVLHHGSYEEIHDAAISLDVDAYFLKNAYLSKMWLETSIEAGESIADPVTRHRCLGMSWNNLAGTLCQLEQFEAAESAIDSSLDHWTDYEEETDSDEHHTVWARYGIGDVYHRWGNYLEHRDDEEAEAKLEEAREVLDRALEIAEQQEMGSDELDPIVRKLHRVESELAEESSTE